LADLLDKEWGNLMQYSAKWCSQLKSHSNFDLEKLDEQNKIVKYGEM
jgi:hypothetical protein